jgi:ribosomal protein S18 acetylase RimI-like enzyme
MTESADLRRGTISDLSSLEPLWVSVHHHHAETMPELAPYVDDRETWAARRAVYAELLDQPDTFLLLAVLGGALVGYGLAHVLEARETWVADTWRTGPRIGEIESLAVLPSHRDRGIGSRLLAALEGELEAIGVHDLVLGVVPGNTAAIRLYERRGYRPTWTYLSRFAIGRPAAGPGPDAHGDLRRSLQAVAGTLVGTRRPISIWRRLGRGSARPEVMPGRAERRHTMGHSIRRGRGAPR